MKDSNSIKEVAQKLYPISDTNWTLKSERDAFIKGVEWLQSQQQEIADIELEKRADNYADDCGYPKSDKEHFETTYWCQHDIAQHSFISGFKAALNQKGNDSDAVECLEWLKDKYGYGYPDKAWISYDDLLSEEKLTSADLYKLFKQSKSLPPIQSKL